MSKLTLKKYGAEWCGPCRMLSPIIKKLAQEYIDTVDVVDIDTDNAPDDELKTISTIRGIPLIIISRDGVELERLAGFRTEAALKILLNELLQS